MTPSTETPEPEPELLTGARAFTVGARAVFYRFKAAVAAQKSYLDELGLPYTTTPRRYYGHLELCPCEKCATWRELCRTAYSAKIRWQLVKLRLVRDLHEPTTWATP